MTDAPTRSERCNDGSERCNTMSERRSDRPERHSGRSEEDGAGQIRAAAANKRTMVKRLNRS